MSALTVSGDVPRTVRVGCPAVFRESMLRRILSAMIWISCHSCWCSGYRGFCPRSGFSLISHLLRPNTQDAAVCVFVYQGAMAGVLIFLQSSCAGYSWHLDSTDAYTFVQREQLVECQFEFTLRLLVVGFNSCLNPTRLVGPTRWVVHRHHVSVLGSRHY